MTHLISCLSDDLLTKVGDYAHEARLKVWRQEHTATLSPLLAEFAEVVADAPDYDRSVFDYEIQAHAAAGGVDAGGYEIDEEYSNEATGAEWIDGREIVWHGAWDETYAGHLVGVAKFFAGRHPHRIA